MSATIDKAFIKTYEGNVRHLVQQMDSRLMDTVQINTEGGKDHSWDRLGPMEASKAVGSTTIQDFQSEDGFAHNPLERSDTPLSDAEWSRRMSIPEKWDLGTTTEREDPTKMLVNPNSNLTLAVSAAMKRGQDDVIIAAATGDAKDGGGEAVVFPDTQIVTNASGGIDVNNIADVQTLFLDNEIDVSVQKYAVVPPSAIKAFMKQEKATSSDYVQAKALQQYGIVKNWMGFDWRTSTRLLGDDDTHVNALFYTKRAIGCQMNVNIETMVDQIPMKRYMWLIYSFMVLGAVRIEDEQIVKMSILKQH